MADQPAFARRFGKAVDHALSMLRERGKVNLQTVPKPEIPQDKRTLAALLPLFPIWIMDFSRYHVI